MYILSLMPTLIISIIVMVILFIIMMYVIPGIKYNNAKKKLMEYSNCKEHKKKSYDFTIETEEVKLYIRLIDVPRNSMITINSKDTWCLSYGGSSKDLGRAYPNKKYLDELKSYLKKDFTGEKKIYKIILVNECTEKIVRYLNESELAVVTFNDTPYGYKIMELTKLEEQLSLLGIKK